MIVYTLQMLTDHSAGNLVGKGDQMNWPQLSQGSVWLLIRGGDLWEWRGWADTTVTKQGAIRGGCHGSHGTRTMVDVFIALALDALRRWQLKVAGGILQQHRQTLYIYIQQHHESIVYIQYTYVWTHITITI